jgi:hypothetical protein
MQLKMRRLKTDEESRGRKDSLDGCPKRAGWGPSKGIVFESKWTNRAIACFMLVSCLAQSLALKGGDMFFQNAN